MARSAVAALVVALMLAGCSSGANDGEGRDATDEVTVEDLERQAEAEEQAPDCADLFADGATTTDAMVDTMCRQEDGGLFLAGTMDVACDDGRRLLWNDKGWGFIGERWHVHEADNPAKVAPDAEREACQP